MRCAHRVTDCLVARELTKVGHNTKCMNFIHFILYLDKHENLYQPTVAKSGVLGCSGRLSLLFVRLVCVDKEVVTEFIWVHLHVQSMIVVGMSML